MLSGDGVVLWLMGLHHALFVLLLHRLVVHLLVVMWLEDSRGVSAVEHH